MPEGETGQQRRCPTELASSQPEGDQKCFPKRRSHPHMHMCPETKAAATPHLLGGDWKSLAVPCLCTDSTQCPFHMFWPSCPWRLRPNSKVSPGTGQAKLHSCRCPCSQNPRPDAQRAMGKGGKRKMQSTVWLLLSTKLEVSSMVQVGDTSLGVGSRHPAPILHTAFPHSPSRQPRGGVGARRVDRGDSSVRH